MKRDSSQAGKEEKKAVCWDKNKGGSGVWEKAQVVDELTKEKKKGLKTKKKETGNHRGRYVGKTWFHTLKTVSAS